MHLKSKYKIHLCSIYIMYTYSLKTGSYSTLLYQCFAVQCCDMSTAVEFFYLWFHVDIQKVLDFHVCVCVYR
jgi:hypothetical protein